MSRLPPHSLSDIPQLWTASNFITNDLETGEDKWQKPFL